jgi:DNA-binding MarR family transcriptional regulator
VSRDSSAAQPLAPAGGRRGSWRAPAAPNATADAQLALSVWLRLLKARSLLLKELRPRIPDGLTVPQFDALAQLERRPDGMTAGELTRELLVTAGNVTGIVARLAARGLLERRSVPEDRRTVALRLTPRGKALMRRAIPRHRRDVRALLAGVPRADLERLRDLLGSMAWALRGEGAKRGRRT